ncbi:hypothetical protein GCM10010260_30290 [Streptomyces filipinensis]|uniref:Uncharacterized protein n=1 Tax=Streptomyces filipinensis TaxID=66887 RepID=A0A918ICD3_9ACTN|nr:hypothetical protein GCM10010260_30290 [Streptomyces filipinensis]
MKILRCTTAGDRESLGRRAASAHAVVALKRQGRSPVAWLVVSGVSEPLFLREPSYVLVNAS